MFHLLARANPRLIQDPLSDKGVLPRNLSEAPVIIPCQLQLLRIVARKCAENRHK